MRWIESAQTSRICVLPDMTCSGGQRLILQAIMLLEGASVRENVNGTSNARGHACH